MEKILKMLFKEILLQDKNIKKIETIEDLCNVAVQDKKIVYIFAANNDDIESLSTEDILIIANKAYQEVCEYA